VLSNMRMWLSTNIASVVFLASYFLTVVLGNILYLLPAVRNYLANTPYMAPVFDFDTLFSVGYWVLLLSPFVVTPFIVVLVRRLSRPVLVKLVGFFPEFSRTSYLVLLLLCYAVVGYSFWHADVFRLFLGGSDFISSVEARFEIRERVSFISMALLMSNLHFLAIYSVVRLVREAGLWWWGVVVGNTLVMTVLLVVLNMKWPVIIFYAGLLLVVFMYSPRRPYLKTVMGMIALLLVYVLISAFVYRVSVPSAPSLAGDRPSVNEQLSSDDVAADSSVPKAENGQENNINNLGKSPEKAVRPVEKGGRYVVALGSEIGGRIPQMMLHAVNRMAILYPYYYEISTKEGVLCGGLLAQAHAGQKCRPSFYIYNKIFNDQFDGRGTAPAAVHITAYALGGWPLAAVGLLCASVLLGLFAALPSSSSSLVAAMATTGGVLGYHLSQLPGEGPIIYDHGVLWTILMLVGYALVLRVFRIEKK